MIINHKIIALQNANQLKKQIGKSALSTEKLSSGLRINRAADDSAGLAISEKMRAQIRGLDQAQRNVQDGMSLLNVAEGGLLQILDPPLQRMRELLIQSENDTLTKSDRLEIQKEIDELKNTINDIAHNTHFNNKKLIDGTYNGQSSILNEGEAAQIIGNVDLSSGIIIAQGVNDSLDIEVNGISANIQLEEGQYNTEEFLQALNAQFINNQVKVSAKYENNQFILTDGIEGKDYPISQFSGKLVESMFLNVEEGQSFVGSTTKLVTSKSNFSNADPKYRTIIEGVNDTLIITMNEDKYELTLKAGTYANREQIRNEINARLNEIEPDIHFYSYVISGGTLGINMLKNNEIGTMSVSGNAASFIFTYKWGGDDWLIGNRDLSTGLTITKGENDILELNMDGNDYSFELNPGSYTAEQLIDELNDHFSKENVNLLASVRQGYSDEQLAVDGYDINVLQIDRTSADTGDVNAIQFSGSAFTNLFLNIDGDSGVIEKSFKIVGNADLSNGLTIEEGVNNTLTFYVDDIRKTIQLETGSYNSMELLDEINNQLVDQNAGVTAAYSENRLLFRHNTSGEYHKINQFSGNAFSYLFLSHEEGKDEVLSEPNQIQLQIRSKSGEHFSIKLMNTDTRALGVDDISVISAANRKEAFNKIDRAMEVINSQRSTIGVIQNRLEHTVNNLMIYSENLTSAESRIRDVDYALIA